MRAILPNPDGRLTPGLFARVRLDLSAPRETLLVAERAIGADQGRHFVLVLNGDNIVEHRPVILGPRIEGLRAVRDGLSADDRIVVGALHRIRPGQAVAPVSVDAGAGREVIAETVAAPLEQEITGVEGLIYMSSQSTADGRMTLTLTFAQGIDPDRAEVQVQNRVARALPRLPPETQALGVVTEKTSPDVLMVVHMLSDSDAYDPLFVSNFALLQVRDALLRLDGVG